MGRAPCCDKANVKKGPWSPEEDATLKSYIEQHGTGGNWIALPHKIGLKRCGKSCRLRWLNYLRPNLKHGGFTEEEDNIICSLYISIGSRWSIIAAQLPGRTDNDIKNYWNTRLKKKFFGRHRKEQQHAAAIRGRAGGNNKNKNQKQQQEMLISRKGSVASDHGNISRNDDNKVCYWPELPVLPPLPYSNEVSPHQLNNDSQASIRKLLAKLGGRFSDDDFNHSGDQQQVLLASNNEEAIMNNHLHHHQYHPSSATWYSSYHHHFQQQQQQCLNFFSAAADLQIGDMSSATDQNMMMNMVPPGGQSSNDAAAAAVDHHHHHHLQLEMLYNNDGINLQHLDGLEFLCGDVLINHKSDEFISRMPKESLDFGDDQMSSQLDFRNSSIAASVDQEFQTDLNCCSQNNVHLMMSSSGTLLATNKNKYS